MDQRKKKIKCELYREMACRLMKAVRTSAVQDV